MSAEVQTHRRSYDYIVVGCGGIGSAALYWLSKRAGSGVLGLEQFRLGHDNGGSQDHTRGIRKTYDEDCYMNLIGDAYKAWEEIERESGLTLLHRDGGLVLAKADRAHYLEKTMDTMKRYNAPFERLTGSELRRRYPVFRTDDSFVALFDPSSAILDAAIANGVHVQLARGHGASVLENCAVTKLDRTPDGLMKVNTTKGEFTCKKVIVTSGAWVNHVLASIGLRIPIYVTQEQVTYFATPNIKKLVKEKCPKWFYPSPSGHDFYTIPIHGTTGYKIGIDVGGPVVTADTRTFKPDPVREKACLDVLKEVIPEAVGPILYTKTCLYTMPPDRNFVIDTCHREGWENVIVCNGAGHAYKFAGLLGKILSEMAIDGRTQYDIATFTLDRPALKDPNFKPVLFNGHESKATANLNNSKL